MINYILHYALIPIKVILITLVASFHKIRLNIKHPSIFYGKSPDIEYLRVGYRATSYTLPDHLELKERGVVLKTNPDHQALRHGSLAWSYPTEEIINGLHNYVTNTDVIRGLESGRSTSVPAMPLSVAHGIVTALKENIPLNPRFVSDFIKFVEHEISTNFEQQQDTNTHPRLKSTAFDAIYALSLLYTALKLTGDKKFLKEANKILFFKGYALLLLAPLTFISDNKRNYFIDHIAMFSLRTAYFACPSPIVKVLLKHAMKFINSQSYIHTNPYMCALAHECGALPDKQRLKVLDVHKNTNILLACKVRSIVYTGIIPSDYSTHSADEFMFDEVHSYGIEVDEQYIAENPLNGLCLAKSLAILMNKEIK